VRFICRTATAYIYCALFDFLLDYSLYVLFQSFFSDNFPVMIIAVF
jgi:hypothetical protein